MEELRTALERDDELQVHLQPQIDLADGRVVGAEALVRWNHPTRGLLARRLLPAAEQAGLLRPLADVVLETLAARRRRWWPTRAVPVSVNLSAANVTDLDLPGKVGPGAGPPRLPARALTLELVEDTLMADPSAGARCWASSAGSGSDVDRRLRHRLQLAGLPAAPARPTSSSSTGASPTTWAWTPGRP